MMFIWLATVLFSYYDSELERDFEVSVVHAFHDKSDAEEWAYDLPSRKLDACKQANWSDFEGVPKDANAYNLVHAVFSCITLD